MKPQRNNRSGEMRREIFKMMITGAISFGASLLYTNYRVSPSHNVSLIAYAMAPVKLCTVSRARLARVIDALRGGSLAIDDRSYLSLLNVIATEAGDDQRAEFVERIDRIPQSSVDRLNDNGVMYCNQQDVRNRVLRLNAGLILKTPGTYLLQRYCTLKYGSLSVRLRTYREEFDIRHPPRETQEPLLVSDTSALFLQYDARVSRTIGESEFADLIEKVEDDHEYTFTLECGAIRESGGSVTIHGAEPFTFKGTQPMAFLDLSGGK